MALKKLPDILNNIDAVLNKASALSYQYDSGLNAFDYHSTDGMSQYNLKQKMEDQAHEEYFMCILDLDRCAGMHSYLRPVVEKHKKQIRRDFIRAFGFDPECPQRELRLVSC